jgi:RNase P/RNase MRP subunit POP5
MHLLAQRLSVLADVSGEAHFAEKVRRHRGVAANRRQDEYSLIAALVCARRKIKRRHRPL